MSSLGWWGECFMAEEWDDMSGWLDYLSEIGGFTVDCL